MIAQQTVERIRQPETGGQELDPKLTREVETILEEAERSQRESRAGTGRWGYRVPCAGVRYYSFESR